MGSAWLLYLMGPSGGEDLAVLMGGADSEVSDLAIRAQQGRWDRVLQQSVGNRGPSALRLVAEASARTAGWRVRGCANGGLG